MAEMRAVDREALESCRCNLPRYVRVNRAGLIDLVLACFGRYPWACRSCGARRYSQERGRRRSRSTEDAAMHRSPYSAHH